MGKYINNRQRNGIATFAFPLTPLNSISQQPVTKALVPKMCKDVSIGASANSTGPRPTRKPVYRAIINSYAPQGK